jgi:hypothetical protein
VIIEGDGVDPALGKPGDDLVLGVEIVGLVTKMVAGVGPSRGRSRSMPSRIARAFSAPRRPPSHDQVTPWKTVSDAVGERLSIAFKQCHVDGKSDSRPRHHLPLERIAVDVDNPGEDQKARGIDRPLAARACAPMPAIVPLSQSTSMLVSSRPLSKSARPPSMRIIMIDE